MFYSTKAETNDRDLFNLAIRIYLRGSTCLAYTDDDFLVAFWYGHIVVVEHPVKSHMKISINNLFNTIIGNTSLNVIYKFVCCLEHQDADLDMKIMLCPSSEKLRPYDINIMMSLRDMSKPK